jgi:hypothetical protein
MREIITDLNAGHLDETRQGWGPDHGYMEYLSCQAPVTDMLNYLHRPKEEFDIIGPGQTASASSKQLCRRRRRQQS